MPLLRAAPVVLLLLAGCRNGGVMTATSEVSAAPGSLAFGPLPVGAELSLDLELRNSGRAPAPLALKVDGPFALGAPPPTEIGGGSSVTVSITFAPRALGAASGTLSLGDGLPTVPLTGEGVAPCQPSQVCRAAQFDLTTRSCVEAPAAEGSACSAPCLSGQGTCRGGYCTGNATSCVDGNACTLDACGLDGGCFHPDVQCPVDDPCQSVFCDVATGCGSTPVSDGTPCGEALCEGANICLGGKCQFRMRPNALLDCRYTALSAGPQHTCAVTRGREVRCWGENGRDQLARGFSQDVAPPGLASGLSAVRSVAASARTVWVSREPGEVAQTNGPTVLPIDASALATGLGNQVCGLERGAVRCGAEDSGVVELAQGVVALAMAEPRGLSAPGELCVVFGDGGVSCGDGGTLVHLSTPGPATSVATAGRGTGCALVGDRAWCWGALADAGLPSDGDAGVAALACNPGRLFGAPAVCLARGSRIECAGDNLVAIQAAMPAPAVAVSIGGMHACALLEDGQVACWGTNTSGQLGDRSNQPLGVQLRDAQATWLGTAERDVLYEAGGAVRALDSATTVANDAGATVLTSTPRTLPGPRAGYAAGCRCDARDAGVFCAGVGPLPGGLPEACAAVVSPSGGSTCVGAGALVRCYARADGGAVEVGAWDAGGQVRLLRAPFGRGVCAVLHDGAVRCDGLAGSAAEPESLGAVKELCLGDLSSGGGCALLDGGTLQCWGPCSGSPTPRVPLGAWPVVRGLACGASHVCALGGVNVVQCWGDGSNGQLGRDGPRSVSAVTVPMPEAVQSIAAGAGYTCALLQSGRLACWGDNFLAQLGVPALNTRLTPRLVRE